MAQTRLSKFFIINFIKKHGKTLDILLFFMYNAGVCEYEGLDMRVTAIRTYQAVCPTPTKRGARPTFKRHLPQEPPVINAVSFKSMTLKGVGAGVLVGLAAMAAISALSGGFATPLAYGAYAALFGTAGGFVGKASEDFKNNKED